MNMDTLLRQMEQADHAGRWPDEGHTAARRIGLYGGIAVLALLLLLLALWLSVRGDGDGTGPLSAPATVAQPKNVPVVGSGTTSTHTGTATGGRHVEHRPRWRQFGDRNARRVCQPHTGGAGSGKPPGGSSTAGSGGSSSSTGTGAVRRALLTPWRSASADRT